MKKWGSFLEYAGLETVEDEKTKELKEVFSGSYSGVDGGDINAEYWFVGMEWSDYDDIKDDYNCLYNRWRKVEEFSDDVDIKDWDLENKLDRLYQKLPNHVLGKKIFEKNSNSFKLNLLPLPFANTSDDHDNWSHTHLTEATGFASFDEYKKGVLPARQKLFKELLQRSKKAKTIFCFGTTYKEGFLEALVGNSKLRADNEGKLPCKASVFVYDIKDCPQIKRIIITYFPLYPLRFDDADWERLAELAK